MWHITQFSFHCVWQRVWDGKWLLCMGLSPRTQFFLIRFFSSTELSLPWFVDVCIATGNHSNEKKNAMPLNCSFTWWGRVAHSFRLTDNRLNEVITRMQLCHNLMHFLTRKPIIDVWYQSASHPKVILYVTPTQVISPTRVSLQYNVAY